ncbi:hypothetical protein BJ508DRAFT_410548 [Ascobolus immersus RN42]|uniref:Uncharacterized protein n=1 Tax=Ascobolus immersus RN42 TaxID=1160509 RepID=A0A3N4IR09_ASCIM|nr:hypothetical protein BJ508DRAFT_410548 [Ascobolus immersus RN42]
MSDIRSEIPGANWDDHIFRSSSTSDSSKVYFGVDDPFFILHIVIAILYFVIGVVLCIICKLKQKTVPGLLWFAFYRIVLGAIAACVRTGWLGSRGFTTLFLLFELGGLGVLVYLMADALYWDGNQKGTRPTSKSVRIGHQIFSSLPYVFLIAGPLVGQFMESEKGQTICDALIITGCFQLLVVFLYLMVYMFTRTDTYQKEGRLTASETALFKATKGALLFLSIRLVWAVVTAFEGRRKWWLQYSSLYKPSDSKSVTEYLKYGILNMLSEFIIIMIYVTTAWMLAKWERVRRKEEEEARIVCASAALVTLGRENRELGEMLDGKRSDRTGVSRAVVELSTKLDLVKWERQPLDSKIRRLVAVNKSRRAMEEYANNQTLGLMSPTDKQYKQAVVAAVMGVGVDAATQSVFAAHEQMLRDNADSIFADELHGAMSEMTVEDPEVVRTGEV